MNFLINESIKYFNPNEIIDEDIKVLTISDLKYAKNWAREPMGKSNWALIKKLDNG